MGIYIPNIEIYVALGTSFIKKNQSFEWQNDKYVTTLCEDGLTNLNSGDLFYSTIAIVA